MRGLYRYAIKNSIDTNLAHRIIQNASQRQAVISHRCSVFIIYTRRVSAFHPHQLWISWAPHPSSFISFSLGSCADTLLFSTVHGFSVAPIKVFNQAANTASLPGFVPPSSPSSRWQVTKMRWATTVKCLCQWFLGQRAVR